MGRAMQETVDEVGAAVAAEGIDCHWAKGGTVQLARSVTQLERCRAEIAEAREYGFGPDDLVLLSADEASARVAATGVLGGTYTPHCAAIHPSRLVRGLADAVQRRGVTIFERASVLQLLPGGVVTPGGTVRARHIIRATEGYTPQLPGQRRAIMPVYSLMVATEPLPDAAWEQIGLGGRATFGDMRHLIIYGQRTADGRLAFGGRGAPYHLGSSVRPSFDRVPAVFAALRETLAELFPVLADVRLSTPGAGRSGWRGTGARPSGWTGVRAGVGGRLCGRWGGHNQSVRADAGGPGPGPGHPDHRLPWVGHQSPQWEPEPLRWLGVNAGLQAMSSAHRQEARTGKLPGWRGWSVGSWGTEGGFWNGRGAGGGPGMDLGADLG